MVTGAVEMMLQCFFDGSISMHDMNIERRPYHRNCTCALHNLKDVFSNSCPQHKNISFPKKKSWNECTLSTEANDLSPPFLHCSSVGNREGENRGFARKMRETDRRIIAAELGNKIRN